MKASTDLLTLEVASLAAGGDGVARANGLVVFTPRTAPGDVVEAEVVVEGRIGRGRLVRVVQPGPSRVEPVCAHYAAPDRCGGCQWQHVHVDEQRAQKQLMVRDAFKRIGKREIPLPPIIGGEPWRYRRTLTLAIRKRGNGHIAGLRAFDDPEAVFALRDCHLTVEPVLAAWREILAAARHLPSEPRLRGTVRHVNDRAHFTLEGGRDWPQAQEFLDTVPSIAAIWWHADGARRRLVADRRPANEPGASFAQVNPEMASQMQAEVVRRALTYEPRTVIDAYAGAGATAVALAKRGVSVVAIEADEDATAYATQRLTALNAEVAEVGEEERGHCRSSASSASSAFKAVAVAARVEDVIHQHLPADVVILNPPRAGVDAKVTAALAKASPAPKAIIYVSCDPATLARDVARLPGWGVHDLTCYDMFPQTSHVESVVELRPEGSA